MQVPRPTTILLARIPGTETHNKNAFLVVMMGLEPIKVELLRLYAMPFATNPHDHNWDRTLFFILTKVERRGKYLSFL